MKKGLTYNQRNGSTKRITLARPDDWHAHFRDGAAMAAVVGATARQFARAIVMPNLKPPVVDVAQAQRVSRPHPRGASEGRAFEPLMTLYLTDDTPPAEIAAAQASGLREGGEVLPGRRDDQLGLRRHRHPQGATRCSRRCRPQGMPLLVHGEVTDPEVDVFDREARVPRARAGARS